MSKLHVVMLAVVLLISNAKSKKKYTSEELAHAGRIGINREYMDDDSDFDVNLMPDDKAKMLNDQLMDKNNDFVYNNHKTEPTSQHMPEEYRCDGCKVIAYKLRTYLKKAEKKFGKLGEVDIIDAVESVCEDKFMSYGLKIVTEMGMRKKFLSGEGLFTVKANGVMDINHKWAVRLQDICGEVIGQFDEKDIYNWYSTQDTQAFTTLMCRRFCSADDCFTDKC